MLLSFWLCRIDLALFKAMVLNNFKWVGGRLDADAWPDMHGLTCMAWHLFRAGRSDDVHISPKVSAAFLRLVWNAVKHFLHIFLSVSCPLRILEGSSISFSNKAFHRAATSLYWVECLSLVLEGPRQKISSSQRYLHSAILKLRGYHLLHLHSQPDMSQLQVRKWKHNVVFGCCGC